MNILCLNKLSITWICYGKYAYIRSYAYYSVTITLADSLFLMLTFTKFH